MINQEKVIQKQIIEYLKKKGFLVTKHHMEGVRARHGGGRGKNPYSGYPDLTAIKDGATLYFEVKGPKGILSDAQKKFHAESYRHGVIVHVVRSLDDVIEIVG